MKWITRARPKIDRIACPWLIQRFIDHAAEFIFVPSDQVTAKAAELGAIPFDVEGVELSHVGPLCTFDAIRMSPFGLPLVEPDKCTACNDCVEACPLGLFVLMPIE